VELLLQLKLPLRLKPLPIAALDECRTLKTAVLTALNALAASVTLQSLDAGLTLNALAAVLAIEALVASVTLDPL
jgi:hypothetical protein